MRENGFQLRAGESLLWESAPGSFALLEGKFRRKILAQWIVTAIFAVWLIYVERDRPEFGTGMKALVAVVAAVIILSPVVEYYTLRQQKYCLTDRRALVRTADRTWYYMDYSEIDSCRILRGAADGDCIAMGSAIMDDVSRQLRWQACHPKVDLQESGSRGASFGMVFYRPEGAEKMVKIMKENGVSFDEMLCE